MAEPPPLPRSAPAEPGSPRPPRLIAWELTRACPLNCAHCRAGGRDRPADPASELTTEECLRVLDNLAGLGRPILILTGGEPLLRGDVYEIAASAHRRGLPVALATCGTPLEEPTARRLVECGVRRVSVSLDGATAEAHDALRGAGGAFESALRGIEAARRAGLEFQINTTVSRDNLDQMPAILELARRLGAAAFNPFLLVPTGRGRDLIDRQLSAEQYEQTLRWLAARSRVGDIPIRVTCAPHYQRILRQTGPAPDARAEGGCLGGKSFAFLSHVGQVQICGFLDVPCGDVRRESYDFARIWRDSEVFRRVRDVDGYRGRCGVCEYRAVCGGCRARAYALTGDYLAAEPLCLHRPAAAASAPVRLPPPLLDADDRRILSEIQAAFPVARWPYEVLAARLEIPSDQIESRVRALAADGVIRRIGGVFDARRLGYVSTLVAAKVPPERLEEVALRVNRLAGVTHNYARRHPYNLWFTLTCASQGELEATLRSLREQTGIDPMHSLPALRAYKLSVVLPLDGKGAQTLRAAPAGRSAQPPARPASDAGPPVWLDDAQRELVRLIQQTLPSGPNPLNELARRWGRPVEILIVHLRHWLGTGLLRRFGAVLSHRRVGFTSNGLAAFRVPEDRVDRAGEWLAGFPQVTHCYRRPTLPDWPYGLLAMVHGHSDEQVLQFARRAAGELGASEHDVLFSTTEYKKTSMRFFLEAG